MAATPPPLPPRSRSAQLASESSSMEIHHPATGGLSLPSCSALGYQRLAPTDARLSSSHSLIAPSPQSDSRRSLLLIYIHGFYGNDLSFQSFPAHVHALLTHLLSDTHVLHSKIYPRYKTYRAIQVARDNFSAWLEPHQSPTTDVILVGHSMGGLLAAEAVLMPSNDSRLSQQFKHRILGTISLDSPFLGLNPGIVVSGLSSLFHPAPNKPGDNVSVTASRLSPDVGPVIDSSQSSLSAAPLNPSTVSSPSSSHTSDALYDPPYFNDVHFRQRPLVSRMTHFALKHKAEGLFNAVGNHILSHLEFGGCMADYPELAARYKRIRALEDVDELKVDESGQLAEAPQRRVRFVNYYTISPGRSKSFEAVRATQSVTLNVSKSMSTLDLADVASESIVGHGNNSIVQLAQKPEIDGDTSPPHLIASDGLNEVVFECKATAVDESRNAATNNSAESRRSTDEKPPENEPFFQDMRETPMKSLQPLPMSEEEDALALGGNATLSKSSSASVAQDELDLPCLVPEPEAPVFPNLSTDMDKDARRQAEKEAKRQLKAYQQAMKDRSKAVREREKIVEKRRKRAEKETRRAEKQAAKEEQRLQKQLEKEAAAHGLAKADEEEEEEEKECVTTKTKAKATATQKSRKLRKFCALPGKLDGHEDGTWVDVYVEDTDEIGAHCGLFLAEAPHYEGLVGDVANRIMQWVHDDMSVSTILSRRLER